MHCKNVWYSSLCKRFGLSAPMAVRCIAQGCGADKQDKTKRLRFRPLVAIPYDQRLLSFKGLDRVSLLMLSGRILVPFMIGRYQSERLTTVVGLCDRVRRQDGKWLLPVIVDLLDRCEDASNRLCWRRSWDDQHRHRLRWRPTL